ncbi:MAG: beta-ketoacyl-ACP synthase II [Chitinophagales bacterium]|jgi:3-oxoacyl-[acyl-carrier-protein] synthase II|nr:beta-ketoacyl-ACP synthase II [Sphingobacteriales bacterium]
MRRVVITGLGAVTPLGNDIGTFWNALVAGTSGANLITKFDTTLFKTKFACELKNFDPLAYIEKKEVSRLDPSAIYAIAAGTQAVEDSGILSNFNPDRVGVLWSSGIGGILTFQQEITNFATGNGTPRFNPFFIPKMIPDISAGHISMKYGFRGPNFAPVAACASSTIAIADAFMYIKYGRIDACVAGGSEAAITEGGIGGFNAMKALSERNDDYLTASRPFDSTRDGFVMGEGGCGLILEELEHALKRGAKIYCEVVGTGMTADAHHLTAPHPEGLGAYNVMKNAIDEAGLAAEEIDYVNVHGTSTPLGDIAELKAIKKLFGDAAYNMNISSTKSQTGHLLGAAGAIEAIACVKSVQEDIIPPTINFTTPDEHIDQKLNLTLNTAQKRTVNTALSNTFGFGGHNASAVFKKFKG